MSPQWEVKPQQDGSAIFEETQQSLDWCSCVGADVGIGGLVLVYLGIF